MRQFRKKGFTLSELMVVLAILTILAAIAIPAAIHYIRLAEFRKNESNAKTVYLAAESELTWYRNSGSWESFRKEIIRNGKANQTFGAEESEKNGRIYAITLNSKKSEDTSPSEKQVLKLLEDNAYDKDFLSAAITIEIDVETGQVYSAFYATHCDGMAYDGDDTSGILDISAAAGNREYENRRDRYLGYYSAEDITNVVDLKPVRLKVSTINLVNSETLSLNWSSNSRHDNLDVKFVITFYKKDGDQKLFSTVVDRKEQKEAGAFETQMARLELTDADESPLGEWTFPLTYQAAENGQNARFSLVLDGIMSSALMESLNANKSNSEYMQTYSTSITRLKKKSLDLTEPQDIYAIVKAEPTYGNSDGDSREYRASRPVQSNDANTMFADGTTVKNGKLEAKISRFRHLSNIRYYAETKDAVFTLTGRNMDWTSAGTGLYDVGLKKTQGTEAGEEGTTGGIDADTGGGQGTAGGTGAGTTGNKMVLQWKSAAQQNAVLDFPSVQKLSVKHKLTGDGAKTIISNLHLGAASMPEDSRIDDIYKNKVQSQRPYTEYVGLFCEIDGAVTKVTLQDPVLSLTNGETAASNFARLSGAGILCGRSQGHLETVTVRSTGKNPEEVDVRLEDRNGDGRKQTGIGGLVGILAKKNNAGELEPLTDSQMSVVKNLTMEGSVTGRLPAPNASGLTGNSGQNQTTEQAAEGYAYGIGGIFGYAWTGNDVTIQDCENHADVSGNLFVGGIAGGMSGSYRGNASNNIDIKDCYNDGLVLCNAAHEESENVLEGRYIGGILGFGQNVQISDSSSASGRFRSYQYDPDKRAKLLVGQYVGGVIGYGSQSRLSRCSTERGGYILGSDYVGGIAGGLSDDLKDVITGAAQGTPGVRVTINAGYVIGNRYVGGIVGKNEGASTIRDCVNQGVAAGYDKYIGGIVGYNGQDGTLENCASYLADYNHAVFNMVVHEWNATGDCAGGLAGYNNGQIKFTSSAAAVNVKSVAGIVVGNDYVGGVIGFNDVNGTLDADYTLIGGQVYAYGDGAGGCVGLNASPGLLKKQGMQNPAVVVTPSGVTGRYYVGGCIGANIVNLDADLEMRDFRSDNSLGSITGEAYTGGIIGYHRTYSSEQLQGNQILDILMDTGGKRQWLPSISDGNVPEAVQRSENPYILTISNTENTSGSAGGASAGSNAGLENANNNVSIFSAVYAGGIVGYCEQGSRLVLKNCMNRGSIVKKTFGNETDQGVSLKKYLLSAGMPVDEETITESLHVSMVGGMISANLENQVIDNCANKGNMNGFIGLGGIVGFNAGRVLHCELTDNFGNTELDYIGGIAGLNIEKQESGLTDGWKYRDVTGKEWEYASGMIASCSTQAGRNILGRSYVGGIAGYNMAGGILQANESRANITAMGDYAGGIAGSNAGIIQVAEDQKTSVTRTISGQNGQGIGGIAGWNQSGGRITVTAAGGNGSEVTAVSQDVSVVGKTCVGGIVGIQEGNLETASGNGQGNSVYLTCQAAQVHASDGYAGGIAGMVGRKDAAGEETGLIGNTAGSMSRARNKSVRVTADHGPAGGIVAVNQQGAVLEQCQNLGDVNSDDGYAGGIAAENYGTMENCSVGSATGSITIRGQGKKEIGAVCAVNHVGATIRDSVPKGDASAASPSITLSGTAEIIGGITGINQGTITSAGGTAAFIQYMPVIESSAAKLTVGAAAGQNGAEDTENAVIDSVTASGLQFTNFSNYQYLGGLTGVNKSGSQVKGCKFINGTIRESGAGKIGNCYGGIVGKNSGSLSGCEVQGITMSVKGAYTALSNSTAEEKEAHSSHVGGIAGKNEANSEIWSCVITKGSSAKSVNNTIDVENGMAGGIVGYNKGTVTASGDKAVTEKIKGAETMKAMIDLAGAAADNGLVLYENNKTLEELSYDTNSGVTAGRSLTMKMLVNGNLGGIAAYNAPSGSLQYCATGNWYLNNKSNAIGVGTGGIIGMNESTEDQSFLLNQAFVGRELSKGDTNRFAGGIIGNQNNTTKSGWKLKNCANYGMVYCLNAHYSGGIIGQWTGTGGNIENCRNYGNLQTTYKAGWVGASAGIVAQLYHAYEGNEYNIISCGNYGSIYGRTKEDTANCANDSAGILGNVTAYNTGSGDQFSIQVLDCVNGSGVEIYSTSMASGIVGFFSCDNPGSGDPVITATGKINLRIERCRNFASILRGAGYVGGILGDRYGADGAANTEIKDCYSVYVNGDYKIGSGTAADAYAIISFASSRSSQWTGRIETERNYYLAQIENKNSFSGSVKLNTGGARGDLCYRLNKDGKDYIIRIDSQNDVSRDDLTIDPANGAVSDKNGRKVGDVLFEISENAYGDLNSVVAKGSIFDDYTRKAYYKIENPETLADGRKQMKAPTAVALSRTGNYIDLNVTKAEQTDPFKYVATLYIGGVEAASDVEFYSENYRVELSPENASLAGDLSVKIQAYSMYDDVEPSEAVDGTGAKAKKALPSPKLRVELHGTEGDYCYQFKLDNPEDYADCGEYTVTVKLTDGSNSGGNTASLTLDTGNNYCAEARIEKSLLQQLLVQANPPDGDENYQSSSQVSVPVYLPAYVPEIALNNNAKFQTTAAVSGTTLENLSITVNLMGNGLENITTPPVYRAELVGTWKDPAGKEYRDTVFQSADILTTANGAASASFTNLPEDIAGADDLKVRVWYAESGLGPVYTYYPVNTETEANIFTWTDQTEDGEELENPILTYSYSPVLNPQAATFNDYKKEIGSLFTWLPRPVFGNSNPLIPDMPTDTDKHLKYTLKWDENEYKNGDVYFVSLTGISGDRRVSILINKEVADNKIQVDAEDWTYDAIELKVTRKGVTEGGQIKIGLTSTEVYNSGQRLPRPAQPTATNSSVDDLFYTIQWAPVDPETGCMAYDIYVQPYQENGTTLAPAVLRDTVNAGEQQNGLYSAMLNLEEYAGKKALIYLVAKADPDDARYVDSVEGITCEVTIPERIQAPVVTWDKSWQYERSDPVSEEAFQADDPRQEGSLKVTIAPDANSTPPGDSSYLYKAYVFDTEQNAGNAIDALLKGDTAEGLTGLLAEYPEGAGPAVMELNRDNTYSHTISGLSAEYAGKWIVPFVRISSGNGQISSKWTAGSDVWRLPYVKLPTPEAAADDQQRGITVQTGTNPDLLEEESWTADHPAFHWSSRKPADAYYITLKRKEAEENVVFRIIEDAERNEVEVFLKGRNEQGEETWESVGVSDTKDGAVYTLALPIYQKEISNVYQVAEIPYTYQLTLNTGLEVSRNGDGGFDYSLILPDTDRLITRNGIEITDEGLRVTQTVDIAADVAVNAPDGSSESDAYILSEPYSAALY